MARRMWTRIASQILTWCGDEPLEVGYDGSLIRIPPVNEVAARGVGSPYRLEAAKTRQGVPLPGTVLVQDVIQEKEDGGFKKIFDVADFCAFLERDCEDLFKRGLAIVSDPDDVRVVQVETRPLYEASMDARAREILAQELQRRKKYEEAGQPAPPGSNINDVLWAVRHQRSRANQARVEQVPTAEIHAVMAQAFGTTTDYVAPRPAPREPNPIVEKPAPQPIPEPRQKEPGLPPVAADPATGSSSLMDAAEEVGLKLSKTDLTKLIRGDKEYIEYLNEEIRTRRAEIADAMASETADARDEEPETTPA